MKLEVFPEENPTQKLPNSHKLAKKFKVRSQICLFWPEIVKILKKYYKVTFIDKMSKGNIPKIQIIP